MSISEANRIAQIEEYYFSKKLKEIKDIEKNGTKVINLGIGNPDLPPSQSTINALTKSAKQSGNHGYQSYKSTHELRKAISDYYAEVYSVSLKPETEILPLIGSKSGIMHISMAFLDPEDEVLIPNPGYPVYASAGRMLGSSIKYYDLKEDENWQINIDELNKIDLSRVKLMWINYPNMPTGKTASPGLFRELIDLAGKNNFLLCNDNAYSLVLNDNPGSILAEEGAKDVCIELNSFSKSHNMAGWRLGWIAGNQQHVKSVLKVKSNIESGIFLPIQHAAIEALRNPDEWHRDRNIELNRRREKVFEFVKQLGCTYDENQAGMFVWAKVPDNISNVENYADEILYRAKVFITPGFIFGSNGERYIRISLCNKEQKIKEAVKRVKNMLSVKTEVKW